MGIIGRSMRSCFDHGMQILYKATKEEISCISKDSSAIKGMFMTNLEHSLDPDSFIEKKYAYILARTNPEAAKKHESRPWTEAELIYLASPENAMTPAEYWAAHGEAT